MEARPHIPVMLAMTWLVKIQEPANRMVNGATSNQDVSVSDVGYPRSYPKEDAVL